MRKRGIPLSPEIRGKILRLSSAGHSAADIAKTVGVSVGCVYATRAQNLARLENSLRKTDGIETNWRVHAVKSSRLLCLSHPLHGLQKISRSDKQNFILDCGCTRPAIQAQQSFTGSDVLGIKTAPQWLEDDE
jgi:hypothetical protein